MSSGQAGGPAHSSCLQTSSSPATLGYQRIEHVEHEGHQSCHGAQNKVPEAALIWCGRATWWGAHPVLGPPGTKGRRPLGYWLLLGLQLLPNPGSLQCAETAISTQSGNGGPSVPETPGHDRPTQMTGTKPLYPRVKQRGGRQAGAKWAIRWLV